MPTSEPSDSAVVHKCAFKKSGVTCKVRIAGTCKQVGRARILIKIAARGDEKGSCDENEEEVHSQCARLFTFQSSAWNEVGTGSAMLPQDENTHTIRFVMRQDTTKTVLADHVLAGAGQCCNLQANAGSQK